MRLLLAFLLAIPATTAHALKPDDFAYGLPLQTPHAAPLHRLEVTEHIYLNSTRADLGDIRIFDARHEPVPFAILPPSAELQRSSTSVPLFPLPQTADDSLLSLNLQTDARGAIIAVSPGGAATSSEPTGYLLDLSQIDHPISGVQLGWEDGAATFTTQVRVQSSNDLQQWRLLQHATLADLRYQGQQLRQNHIELPATRARYLRIDWPQPEVQLIEARVERRETETPEWQWLTLTPSQSSNEGTLFDSGGYLPVQRLSLSFAERNQVLSARLDSAATAEGPWHRVHAGTFYHLTTATGDTLEQPPAAIPTTRSRYWRLQKRDAGSLTTSPQLRLGWQPQQLIFLDQGAGPYLLTYGKEGVEPDQADIGALLAATRTQQDMIAEALTGERLTLAGPAALATTRAPAWRSWILWGLLVAASLILTGMALQLLREVRDSD